MWVRPRVFGSASHSDIRCRNAERRGRAAGRSEVKESTKRVMSETLRRSPDADVGTVYLLDVWDVS